MDVSTVRQGVEASGSDAGFCLKLDGATPGEVPVDASDFAGVPAAYLAEDTRDMTSAESAGSRRLLKCHTTPARQQVGGDDAVLSSDSENAEAAPQRSFAKRASRESSSIERLRQLRELELTRDFGPHSEAESSNTTLEGNGIEADKSSGPSFSNVFAVITLRLCGVIPWGSGKAWEVYSWLIVLVAFLSVGSSFQQIWLRMQSNERSTYGFGCNGHFSDMAFSLGAAATLLCSRRFHKRAQECNALMASYATKRCFYHLWGRVSSRDALSMLVVWLILVSSRWQLFSMRSLDSSQGIEL
jgi:hypothetical protein